MTKPTGRLLFAYNTIASLNEHITELQVRLSNAETMSGKEQSIRDLEQQAKGIKDLNNNQTSVGRMHNGGKRSFIFSQDAGHKELSLRNQALALKEQDNG